MSDEELSRLLCRAAFDSFVRVVTSLMNVVGVDDMCGILRKAAYDLEANREALETARARPRVVVRGPLQ